MKQLLFPVSTEDQFQGNSMKNLWDIVEAEKYKAHHVLAGA